MKKKSTKNNYCNAATFRRNSKRKCRNYFGNKAV